MLTEVLSHLGESIRHISFLGIFLWFISGCVLVVIAKVTGWMQRKAWWYKLLVALYFIYIPVAFLLVGVSHGIILSQEKMMYSHLERAEQSINAEAVTKANDIVQAMNLRTAQEPVSLKLLVSTFSEQLSREYILPQIARYLPGGVRTLESGYGATLSQGVAQMVSKFLLPLLEKKLIATASSTTGLDESVIASLWEQDVRVAIEGGLVINIAKQIIHNSFAMAYKKIYPIWAIMLLIPFIEMALYRHYCYRKKKKAIAPMAEKNGLEINLA